MPLMKELKAELKNKQLQPFPTLKNQKTQPLL
jgi:hypothetical protein